MDEIILNNIDTSIAAKNFLKKLQKNKTYFLNGKWGSGKTEFLNSVKQEAKKQKVKKKFIDLDIRNTRDNRSLMEIAYSKLHPLKYMLFKICIILCIAISVLATPTINLGIEKWLTFNLRWGHAVILFGTVIALSVTVWQILKIKSDTWYSKHISKGLSRKVLIIDDFDRASEERQKEAYKLFNVLNVKRSLPIVFVGDFTKIAQNNEGFLQKIIDNKIELPYSLHPKVIWNHYFEEIEKKFNVEITYQFKQIFIEDGRNLRDREHFNNYVTQEFIDGGKYKHAQVLQQLLVIYIYLFRPLKYQGLVDGLDIAVVFADENDIADLLSENQNYPVSFAKDRKAYFLYESVSNMTLEEGEKIVNNDKAIKDYLYSDYDADFYKYFIREYAKFLPELKEKLFKLALRFAQEMKVTPIVKYIIGEEKKNVENSYGQASYIEWVTKLDNSGLELDESEKIYILERFAVFSFEELSHYHDDIDLDSSKQSFLKMRSYYLLLYLAQKGLWGSFNLWDEAIWRYINSMDDRNYLAFWVMQGVMDHHLGYENAFVVPKDKQYIIITKSLSEKWAPQKRKSRKLALEKIQKRLDEMRERGYIFVEQKD
ncbi:P-loop NTPase fold protein [Pediococcus acidilactici]|uniref:P-loop NTPase fold protein n=1 Tax=Pediococcus acidilactici TaxID=1254 RepID=UPI002F268D8B